MAGLQGTEIIKNLLSGIPPGLWIGIGVLILLKLLLPVWLPKIKGWLGERAVVRGLRQLDPEHYQAFHDLYLPRPDGKGATQIDHVVVST